MRAPKNCIAEAVLTSTHSLYFEQKYEKYQFLSENFQFLEVKFSVYLNTCVSVMHLKQFDPGLNHLVKHVCRNILGKYSSFYYYHTLFYSLVDVFTFTILWANSADDKLMIFIFIFF